ncbi:MAG: DUF4339 domain-containing protein [Muribaculaceae bacterium]|nr:DUF4339 domain-containing protein [Muribaculaceae bacterium]
MDNDSFYSIDRLMEFGMGMAMARQMIGIMNQTMAQMQVPGSMATIPQPQTPPIHVSLDGQAVGPLTETEFARLVTERKVNKDTLVWTPGMLNWQPLEQVPSVLKIVAMAPPPLPTNM